MKQVSAILMCAAMVLAQSFSVASIKANDPGARKIVSFHNYPNGRVTAEAITLKVLIQIAYDVQPIQIDGGPGWIGQQTFDLDARGGDGSVAQVRPMIRSLLEDRFKLKVHRETREVSEYTLQPVKAGAALGPEIHPSQIAECPAEPPPAPEQVQSGAWVPCGAFSNRRGALAGRNVPLSALKDPLSSIVGRPVQDKTGVEGKFDIRLEWNPDSTPVAPGDVGGTHAPDATDIFTAVKEQLGLKLESTKGPVEMLVIDHAEQPSAN